MMTPQEIQEQKFEKAVFGGYDMAQIDHFLDEVLNDYSSLYKENVALKAKMRVLVNKVDEYRAVDEEMRKALYSAQVSAKDTLSRAQAEAERLLRDARTTASQSVTDLSRQVEEEESRLAAAKQTSVTYAEQIRRMMEQAIQQVNGVIDASGGERSAAQVRPTERAQMGTQPPAGAPMTADAPRAMPKNDAARVQDGASFSPKPRFDFSDLKMQRDEQEQAAPLDQ